MSPYAGAAIGAGVSGTFGIFNNIMAGIRESEARRENYEYGEKAADNADARTRALYENYQSPQALLRQYKEAGLSPSLMFANGAAGAGGMTQGAQGAGATGVNPNIFGINVMEGAQLGLMQAQARKTNAEADTIEGKNQRGKLELQAKSLDNELQEYENYVASQTMQFNIEEAHQKAMKLGRESENIFWNTEHQKIDYDFKSETYKTRVDQVKQNFINTAAETLLKESQIKLNEAQTKALKEQLMQGWEQLRLKGEEISVSKMSVENQKWMWEKEIDNFQKKLQQDMLQFNKDLTFRYVNMGCETVAKLASGGITGLILKAIK